MAFTFTERLALIIDARTGGAVSEIRQVQGALHGLGSASGDMGDQMGLAVGSMLRIPPVVKAGLIGAGIAGGAALVQFGRTAVQTASAVEEQMTAAAVIFGDFADEVVGFAEDSALGFNLSTRAALEASNSFGNLLTVVGFADGDAAKFSTTLTSLAGDLASFRDVAVGDALTALRAGLVGEAEPLRRLGVFLSEAKVRSEAAALGFKEMNGELSDQAKVAARVSIILRETEQAQGDAERTSGSFANQQRRLAANLENLAGTVGEAVVPALSGLAQVANDTVGPLTAMVEKLNEFDGVLVDIAQKTEGNDDFLSRMFRSIVSAGQGVTGSKFIETGEAIEESGDAAQEADKAYSDAGDSLRSLSARAGAATSEVRDLRDAMRSVEGAFFGALDAQDAYERSLSDIDDASADLARAKLDLADASREEAEAQRDAQRAVEDAQRAILNAQRNVERSLFRRDEAGEDVADAQRAHTEAVRDFGPNSKAARDAADQLEDAQFRLKEAGWDVEEAQLAVVDAHERLIDAQQRVERQSDRVKDATARVEDAQRRLADAQAEAARKAIELEEKLADEQSTLSGLNDEAREYLRFLETVQRKHPEVAASLQPLIDKLRETIDLYERFPAQFSDERNAAGFLTGATAPAANQQAQARTIHIEFNITTTDPDGVAREVLFELDPILRPSQGTF